MERRTENAKAALTAIQKEDRFLDNQANRLRREAVALRNAARALEANLQLERK